jgi:hypothetical protein
MPPLVIRFPSKEIYYPLRVNRLYTGPSDVQLILLTDQPVPSNRFKQIGFFASQKATLSSEELDAIWAGFRKRLTGRVEMQCFYMPDPRTFYRERQILSVGNLIKHQRVLEEEAYKRWAHDVRISLVWGKKADPDYKVEQFPLQRQILYEFLVSQGYKSDEARRVADGSVLDSY